MGSLVEEGYVTSRKGAFHGSINFFFKITAKGRQALK
jgi:DNA-binding PadR family transcriptional regulator